ncbi:elongation factor P [Candidatus Poribacteria bacterium]|nr:elongation factor P [Candidatus Poribacteria bacterium]
MITANDFRTGQVILVDDQLYSVVSFSHVKPGKGGAYVRTKIKRLSDGNVLERTFRSEEKIEDVRLESKTMQYLYKDGDLIYLMDTETYEQQPMSVDTLDEALDFLVEGGNIEIEFYEDKPVGFELPPSVELEIVKTDPGVRGDTATGGSKPATLSTGYVVQVPLFIQQGETIKIDTRTGEYLERA